MEPQSFSFSKKRAHSWTVTQEEMRFEGSQVKALPLSRKRMMPPTPLQHSCSSFEEEQGHFEVEGQDWSARDRTVIARTKQYLEESKSLKVEVEELESLVGPDEARDKKGCAILETFSSDGPSEFLVVSRTRFDEHQRRLNAQREELRSVQPTWQQNSSSSSNGRQWQAGLEEQRVAWSSSERKVIAVEDCLESFAKNGHGGFGALDGGRRTRREEAAIFSSSWTQKRKRTISWQAKGVGWSTKERG